MKTARLSLAVLLVFFFAAACSWAQLLDHLQQLAANDRLPVGDPSLTPTNGTDGPKSIVSADFDADGKADLAIANKDGSITIYYGDTNATFATPVHLHPTTNELRGLVAADFWGNGRADLAVASPVDGNVHFIRNLGARVWSASMPQPTWIGARDLAAGDFDGDGRADLVIAGSTNGLAHWRGLGTGSFMIVTNLPFGATTNLDTTQPAFYLRAFREPGETRDELVMGRANFETSALLAAYVFGADSAGALEFRGLVTNLDFNALDIGPVFSPASNGIPDLVVSDNSVGSVSVRRGIPALPQRFAATNEIFLCPGGSPRQVRIADFDGDGWNDVAVVQSRRDHVLVYRNEHGSLVEWLTLAVGYRPREMVVADFNLDNHPDLAVLNRDSQDISIVVSGATGTNGTNGGFTTLDGIYPVSGEVIGLDVRDLNGDGYDDVIQLHRSSGLLTVRLAETNGALRPAVSFSMGGAPSALALHDVNNDGHLDALAACLANSVVVRLGMGDGTFGPAVTNSMPQQSWGNLFALFPADLDGDGFVDIAAGYYDCRLALFKGNGTATFQFRSVQSFAYESHAIAAADFDLDGDLDVVAFGYDGQIVVLENQGDLLTATNFHKVITRVSGYIGAEAARAGDFNHDGKPDLMFSGGDGARIVFGRGDLMFDTPSSGILSGVSAASFALADADGDGIDDLILAGTGKPTVLVLKGSTNGTFTSSFQTAVPSSALIASGDLDGDGLPDLVGTGDVLWTALSSRAPTRVPAPPNTSDTNAVPARVFINEVLAANANLPLSLDGGRKTDWLEIFSSIPGNTDVSGWKLLLEKTNFVAVVVDGVTNLMPVTVTNTYTFPTGTVLSNGTHLVLVCSETLRSPYHTGFKLPAEAAVLCLCNPAGTLMDVIYYPSQEDDMAYGRYRDGLPGFTASKNPTPGLANTDDGPVPPEVSLQGLDAKTLTLGVPLRFFATAHDDIGVRNVSLIWRRLDFDEAQDHRVILYDDGMHGTDAAMGDGVFTGVFADSLPNGAAIQFYLECTDLSGQVTTSPGSTTFAAAGQPSALTTLAIGGARPALEISEIVADNRQGLRDENNGTPDWIEVRNTSTNSVSLAGLQVAGRLFGNSSRYSFPAGSTLAPGQHIVLYADAKTNQGPFHLPFGVDRNGDEVWLTGTGTSGARSLIDTVSFGYQNSDLAWARLGVGGPWRVTSPTPFGPNLSNTWTSVIQTNNTFTLGFPTQLGFKFTVEYSDTLLSNSWTALPAVDGNGVERSITQPVNTKRFYRVRRY